MMGRPKRAKSDLSRRTRTRDAKPRILVVCEGETTEIEYLDGIKQFFGSLPVNVVRIGRGKDPLGVVRRAVGERDTANKDAKRERDQNLRFEQVWCLVDVDEHTRVPEAMGLAQREGIEAVVSNPCFELWLLYHFQELGSSVHRSVLCGEKLGRHISGYDKHLPPDFPYGEHPNARARALRAAAEHTSTCVRGKNPSTNVWMLVDAIQRVGKPSTSGGAGEPSR